MYCSKQVNCNEQSEDLVGRNSFVIELEIPPKISAAADSDLIGYYYDEFQEVFLASSKIVYHQL